MKTSIVRLLEQNNELQIKQGDAYPILFTLYDQDGNIIGPDVCDDIVICIGDIKKRYSEDQINYSLEENSWVFPLQQIDSYHLLPGIAVVEVVIKFKNNEIVNQQLNSIKVIPSKYKVIY